MQPSPKRDCDGCGLLVPCAGASTRALSHLALTLSGRRLPRWWKTGDRVGGSGQPFIRPNDIMRLCSVRLERMITASGKPPDASLPTFSSLVRRGEV